MIDKSISDQVLTVGPDHLSKGGISHVLYTYFTEIFREPKYIVETLSAPRAIRLAYTVGAFFSLVYRLATDRKIKIVHLHTATKVSFPRSAFFAKIARLFGKKTILHVHGSNFDDYYNANRESVGKALAKADRIVALSETWRDFFEDQVGLRNVSVVVNPFSTPKRVAASRRGGPFSQCGADQAVHALFLGILGKRKGIFDLLEALSLIHARLKGRFVLHVGGNGEVNEFKKALARMRLDDIVKYEGWVKDDAKEALLNQSSIFILPSYGEGLPISILEAMAYGTSIISTPVGGIPEVVDDSNGVLVQPGDVSALAAHILDLVDNPDKVAQMCCQSMTKTEPYKSENVAKKLEELYRSMLNE